MADPGGTRCPAKKCTHPGSCRGEQVGEEVQVVVRLLAGATVLLHVDLAGDASDAMMRLGRRARVPEGALRLLSGGKQLQPGLPLREYGVRRDSLLVALPRLRGGGGPQRTAGGKRGKDGVSASPKGSKGGRAPGTRAHPYGVPGSAASVPEATGSCEAECLGGRRGAEQATPSGAPLPSYKEAVAGGCRRMSGWSSTAAAAEPQVVQWTGVLGPPPPGPPEPPSPPPSAALVPPHTAPPGPPLAPPQPSWGSHRGPRGIRCRVRLSRAHPGYWTAKQDPGPWLTRELASALRCSAKDVAVHNPERWQGGLDALVWLPTTAEVGMLPPGGDLSVVVKAAGCSLWDVAPCPVGWSYKAARDDLHAAGWRGSTLITVVQKPTHSVVVVRGPAPPPGVSFAGGSLPKPSRPPPGAGRGPRMARRDDAPPPRAKPAALPTAAASADGELAVELRRATRAADDMEKELKRVAAEGEDSRAKAAALEEEVRELKRTHTEAARQSAAFQAEAKDCREMLSRSETVSAALRANVAQLREAATINPQEHCDAMAAREADAGRLEDERLRAQHAEERLGLSQASLRELQAESASREVQLRAATAWRLQAERRGADAEAEIAELGARLATTSAALDAAEQGQSQLSEDLSRERAAARATVRAALGARDAETSSAAAEAAQTRRELEALGSEAALDRATMQAGAAALRAQLAERDADVEGLRTELREVRAQLESSSAERNRQTSEAGRSRAEADRARSELSAERAASVETHAILEEALAASREEAARTQAGRGEAEASARRETSLRQLMEGEVAVARTRSAALTAELRQASLAQEEAGQAAAAQLQGAVRRAEGESVLRGRAESEAAMRQECLAVASREAEAARNEAVAEAARVSAVTGRLTATQERLAAVERELSGARETEAGAVAELLHEREKSIALSQQLAESRSCARADGETGRAVKEREPPRLPSTSAQRPEDATDGGRVTDAEHDNDVRTESPAPRFPAGDDGGDVELTGEGDEAPTTPPSPPQVPTPGRVVSPPPSPPLRRQTEPAPAVEARNILKRRAEGEADLAVPGKKGRQGSPEPRETEEKTEVMETA